MDDRGEGATFEDVPELVEDDISAQLDATVVAVALNTKPLLEEELDATAVVGVADHSALIDEFDATVVTSIDSEVLLDSTLDETVVVMEGISDSITEDTQSLDELDSTVVSVETDNDSNVLLSGLVGLIEPVDVVETVEGIFDQFESNAPAPPPVCTVEGARVPSAESQRLAPGPRWIEKDRRAGPSSATRGIQFLFFLVAAAAVGYALYQNQRVRVDGETLAVLAEEVVPPKGQGLMLVPAQVRYCLAQGVRLGSAAEQAVGLSAAASARMRLVFSDFDQRCSDYQFEPGSFLVTKQGVDADRAILEQQGLSLLASMKLVDDSVKAELAEPVARLEASLEMPEKADVQEELVAEEAIVSVGAVSVSEESHVVSVLPAKPVATVAAAPITSLDQEPRRIIKDMQWRLFKLGLFNGSVTGVYGESTEIAVKKFFRTHSEITESQVESEIYSAIDSVYVKQ